MQNRGLQILPLQTRARQPAARQPHKSAKLLQRPQQIRAETHKKILLEAGLNERHEQSQSPQVTLQQEANECLRDVPLHVIPKLPDQSAELHRRVLPATVIYIEYLCSGLVDFWLVFPSFEILYSMN